MSSVEKKWYVLRAVSGKEGKVKEYLEADIQNNGLSDYVTQVLIPTEKVYSVSKTGKKMVKCYNCKYGQYMHNTPNVLGFLGGSDNPTPLRQSEVNRILGTVDELQERENMTVEFHIGENVKVNVGPFSGFTGVVEEVNNEKKKLKVMVKIFGRKTPLELGFLQVEKE